MRRGPGETTDEYLKDTISLMASMEARMSSNPSQTTGTRQSKLTLLAHKENSLFGNLPDYLLSVFFSKKSNTKCIFLTPGPKPSTPLRGAPQTAVAKRAFQNQQQQHPNGPKHNNSSSSQARSPPPAGSAGVILFLLFPARYLRL